MCEAIVEPFEAVDDAKSDPSRRNKAGAYRWGDSDLPMRSGRIAAMNALSVHFRVPPREIVFLHRRLAGVFIMLATLHCEVDGRARSEERRVGKECVSPVRFRGSPAP